MSKTNGSLGDPRPLHCSITFLWSGHADTSSFLLFLSPGISSAQDTLAFLHLLKSHSQTNKQKSHSQLAGHKKSGSVWIWPAGHSLWIPVLTLKAVAEPWYAVLVSCHWTFCSISFKNRLSQLIQSFLVRLLSTLVSDFLLQSLITWIQIFR